MTDRPWLNPDRACAHEDFAARVEVNRITTNDVVVGYSAELTIRCARCDEAFRFIGMPAGLMPDRPACSPDETEARLPIRPASMDDDFGMGLPGFAVRYHEGEHG